MDATEDAVHVPPSAAGRHKPSFWFEF